MNYLTDMWGLNDRQTDFVMAYMANGFNATKARTRAVSIGLGSSFLAASQDIPSFGPRRTGWPPACASFDVQPAQLR